MKQTITFSGFTDEIASDFEVQLATASKLGLGHIEIRGVNGRNISSYFPKELEPVCQQLNKYGMRVSSVGSPIGKIKITDDFTSHWETFKNTIELAKTLDTRYIRIFSFFLDGQDPKACRDEVFRRLSQMIDYAAAKDVILLHENEKDIYGDTAVRCADILEHLGCANFRGVFDFANFVQCGQDTLEAYELLRDHITYIHIKDALWGSGKVVPAGMGGGNVKELLGRFRDSGYEGFLSLEPHLQAFKGFAALERGVEGTGDSEAIDGGYTFSLALQALKSVLWDLNWR